MRPVRFFVSSVADGWDVLCPSGTPQRFPNRFAAIQAARNAAQDTWREQRAAAEVLINEDDGAWHLVAAYGDLLDG